MTRVLLGCAVTAGLLGTGHWLLAALYVAWWLAEGFTEKRSSL